jgi:hypothetical protein
VLEKEDLLSKSTSENLIRIDSKNKNYTIPRSFGVYEIQSVINTKRFRFGNHPVRENELIREFETIKRIGLFLDRADAKALTNFLNKSTNYLWALSTPQNPHREH